MVPSAVVDFPAAVEGKVEHGAALEVCIVFGGDVTWLASRPGPDCAVGDGAVDGEVVVSGGVEDCIVEEGGGSTGGEVADG